MFNLLFTTFKISYTEGGNSLIYVLTKLPLLGKKIPESLYEVKALKVIMGVISCILKFIGGFLSKGLYLGLMILLPITLLIDVAKITLNDKEIFFHLFFILNFIGGSLMNSVLSNTSKITYTMIVLMRVDAKKYYLGQIFLKIISQSIFFAPLIIIVFGVKETLIILFLLAMFRFIGDAIVLLLFEKFKIIFVRLKVLPVIMLLAIPVIAYGTAYFKIIISRELIFSLISMSIIVILGLISLVYLVKNRKYTLYSKKLLTKDVLFNGDQFNKDINFADVTINEKKFTEKDLDSRRFNKYSGYEYLNEIFFHRHKKIAVNAIKRVVIVICIAIVGCIGALIIFPDIKDTVGDMLLKSSTYLVFIMYLISPTEKICKGMFFNCDIGLLRQGYYKEGKAIVSNFTIRLRKILAYNIIPAITLCGGIILIAIITGKGSEFISLIPTLISVISLCCFFSIYHLFMYYIIQPYTKDLQVKSPIFHGANFVIYIVAFNTFGMKVNPMMFSFIVIAITLIFIPIALVTVYRVAPKTFKLK